MKRYTVEFAPGSRYEGIHHFGSRKELNAFIRRAVAKGFFPLSQSEREAQAKKREVKA